MVRVSREKHAELESFWRFHHDKWVRDTLNQREYCALHGLPLKRFGNWRVPCKEEAKVRKSGLGLLYRRGGLGHNMASHMSSGEIGSVGPGYIPSAKAISEARHTFSLAYKKRIVAETGMAGASLFAVARRHGFGVRLLFLWKKDLAPQTKPLFLQ